MKTWTASSLDSFLPLRLRKLAEIPQLMFENGALRAFSAGQLHISVGARWGLSGLFGIVAEALIQSTKDVATKLG